MKRKGLRNILTKKALHEKTPFWGIYLGMQLMTTGSEEGSLNGLGLIEGYTRRLPNNFNDRKLMVPHIGWNLIQIKKQNPLIDNLNDKVDFTLYVHIMSI